MDTWLRQVLVPALPRRRQRSCSPAAERPVAGWFALDGLPQPPAGPARRSGGAAAARAPRRARRARRRASTGSRAGIRSRSCSPPRASPSIRSSALEDAAMTRVVEELSRLYLEDVDDPLARRALEAASRRARARPSRCSPRCSRSRTAARRCAGCSISRSSTRGRDGLVVHEAVREAVAGFLRGANPVRYRQLPARRLARAAQRGPRGGAGGAVALHRGHALPDRQPGRPRGVLPERHAAARRRAGPGRATGPP